MQSDDIKTDINKRIIEQATGRQIESFAGLPIILAFQSPEERAKLFKKALFDYSIEKLEQSEEKKVAVEDMTFIMSKLNQQFSCEDEKEAFYKNYVSCLLDAYGDLTASPLVWQDESSAEDIEFPRVIDGIFQTPPSVSYEDATLWLFEKFDQQLNKTESPKIKKKTGGFHW